MKGRSCQFPGCTRGTQGAKDRCPSHSKHRPDASLRDVRWGIVEAMYAGPIPDVERVALRWWLDHFGGAEALRTEVGEG